MQILLREGSDDGTEHFQRGYYYSNNSGGNDLAEQDNYTPILFDGLNICYERSLNFSTS